MIADARKYLGAVDMRRAFGQHEVQDVSCRVSGLVNELRETSVVHEVNKLGVMIWALSL